ncbi:MAG TPA: hypothetical protein VGG95_14685 [Edaphobacter sp.]
MNWKAITATVFMLVLICAAAGFVRDSRIDTDFPAIRAKSSEAEVRRIMGGPKQIQSPCQAYDTSVAPDCNHVFVYRSIFYPLRNKYWLVFFDQNNQVTATSSQREP